MNFAHLIRFALDRRVQTPDRQLSLDMHLGALRPIESIPGEPRQIILGDYDALSLIGVSIEIEFERGWVRCIFLDGKPSVCRLSDSICEQGLACLLASEAIQGEGCEINICEGARVVDRQAQRHRRQSAGGYPCSLEDGRAGRGCRARWLCLQMPFPRRTAGGAGRV